MHRWKELIPIAQMVLAELAGGVAQGLEHLGDGRILFLQSNGGAGHAHLGQPGAQRILPGNEARPARGAALLRVVVGEGHPFVRHTVNVRRPIAHRPAAVEADVPPANVIAPENQDIRFFAAMRCSFRSVVVSVSATAASPAGRRPAASGWTRRSCAGRSLFYWPNVR